MQIKNKDIIHKSIIVILVLSILAVMVLLDIYKCPARLIVGVPCPFCGMTRAFMSILHGNIADSFYYHPLWPVAIIAILIITFDSFFSFNRKFMNISLTIISVMFLCCFIYRHLHNSPIVEINFSKSIIGRIFTVFAD